MANRNRYVHATAREAQLIVCAKVGEQAVPITNCLIRECNRCRTEIVLVKRVKYPKDAKCFCAPCAKSMYDERLEVLA
jgi:hypothetical protein